MDRAATVLVTFGGVCVILAVLGILVYLIAVVAPLFEGASLPAQANYTLRAADEPGKVLFAELDEYRALGLAAISTGEMIAFAAHDGAIVERRSLFPAAPPLTASSQIGADGSTAFGFADGTVRTARFGFATSLADSTGAAGTGVSQTLPDGTQRRISSAVQVDEPILVGQSGVPVVLLDYRDRPQSSRMVAVKDDMTIWVSEVTRRRNLLTGRTTSDVSTAAIPYPEMPAASRLPAFALLTSTGDQLYLAWTDGMAMRYDLRDVSQPVLAERTDLTPRQGVELTALRFMTGEQSILAGDSAGGTNAWFRVARDGSGNDGFMMVLAHALSSSTGAITALGASTRDRTVATGSSHGEVAVHFLTSERRLAHAALQPPGSIVAAQIAPKSDALFVMTSDGRAGWWSLDSPHPQASLRALFGKVWYEGYPEPAWTWQSSSGTDDFEPKFSLVPLMFGTLKATLYSMVFAVPIAFCAALYTSEFLDRRFRATLKSTIEMMASLPSVVLGFVAALVLAPLVESRVLAVLAAIVLTPLAALGSGYAWQMLPSRFARFSEGKAQPVLIGCVVIAGLALSLWLASPLEQVLFQGDFKSWLDGRTGTGAPGLGLLLWPLILVAMLAFQHRLPWVKTSARMARSSRSAAAAELLRFLTVVGMSIIAAWVLANLGGAMGIDLRGGLVGTYAQRNALVVGFVMGFAVIPIIYTIAEDALTSVPQALRSASLGCGATRWQTAIRVTLPVALPGLFSAMMIGLGRAVGETMIVLMAAGNTPVMEMNVFSGLRTLSANIAVELPEAARGGTLYRTLFLAALLLFALTFALNTLAEIIRQRFRWKALS